MANYLTVVAALTDWPKALVLHPTADVQEVRVAIRVARMRTRPK
jgi:hypothetical protein